MLTFKRNYFLLATAIFIAEVLIALFVKDRFVRPYIGDVLVVILLYCGLKSVLIIRARRAALVVIVIAYMVELLQYLKIIKLLGLEQSTLAKTILGTTFVWWDLIAYTAGVAIILLVENILQQGNPGEQQVRSQN